MATASGAKAAACANPAPSTPTTDMSTITPTDLPAMAGIVLAGGLSSRMGQDKALLRWQGRSLLAHMCALLQAAGAQTLRVSGSYPVLPGVESVPDLVPRCGPLGGLYSVVKTLPDGPVWVVAVDMPLLDRQLLWRLRDAGDARCVHFRGQPLPMRLNIDRSCRTLLQSMVMDVNGPRSLYRLQRQLGSIELRLPDDGDARLLNCNTPIQWEALPHESADPVAVRTTAH
ncbi:molybdenum cofactor guanylyltransferase [Stenotrophomonas maltophilia]|nr:molybdenum cofactor guanylyltransferase [Stenotrophomonas maltophilia]CCP15033.1 Bifunctional protein glmU (UDP-N-acetylglucosamine pyrophosphorylase, Glucosamine-1-phosphate N-acetyltransferase) [Stenotrophomonas maltophilia RA8]